MPRLAISLAHADQGILHDIEQILGYNRLFRQGTDTRYFAEYVRRDEAHLAMIGINQIQGCHAHIEGDLAN